jgi:hypothetical protein
MLNFIETDGAPSAIDENLSRILTASISFCPLAETEIKIRKR